jgi:DNA-binding beta-propeller fold protein YncE
MKFAEKRRIFFVRTFLSVLLTVIWVVGAAAAETPMCRSPLDVAWLDAKTVAVSDASAGKAYLVDTAAGKVTQPVALTGEPGGVAAGAGVFFVSETGAGTVAEVGTDGAVKRRFAVGARPAGVALAGKTKRLIVADHGLGFVTVVDLGTGTVLGKITVSGLPYAVAVVPDEKLAVTASRLPVGDARLDDHAAILTLLDLTTLSRAVEVKLTPGAGNLTGMAISPDGKWLYLPHTLARFTLPTTQLERGWVNTNALTIVDLAARKLYATLLLDTSSQGAADPWGVALAPDGQTAWITLAGVHELARLDLKGVHEWLAKLTPEARAALANDLAAVYVSRTLTRLKVPGSGPRGVAVSPDGATVAVSLYFSGELALVDATTSSARTITLGAQPAESPARKGERIFHDGTLSFQSWLSCATCHPAARADGFNWDLLNDDVGNPKNTRSMVWADRTPPMMSLGVREDMPHAVRAGFRFILFREPAAGETEAVSAYMQSLEPARSPHLVPKTVLHGPLSAEAQKGKKLFKRAGCAECHPAPLFTDKKVYEVGTNHVLDRDTKLFDTPTLVELWRTAPYLHDGSAVTMEEVLTKFNLKDQHGKTSNLTPAEIAELVAYLLSL